MKLGLLSLIAATATVLLGASAAVARAEDTTQPAVLRDVGIDQHLDEQVPLDLAFRDEQGQAVTLGQYFGNRPVILALVYYECPMLCTLTLNGLTSALRSLRFDAGEEFEVVAVSINPNDAPTLAAEKKRTYLEHYARPGREHGWHFLTGDEAAIARLAHAVGFRYRYLPEQKQFAHAAGITVLTPGGRIARYFFGVEYAPRDLRLGLIEASQNKIGSPVDQLLLYCYHYDPITGTYSAIAMNIVRLAGAMTVLALVVFFFVMRRLDRAAARRPVEVVG